MLIFLSFVLLYAGWLHPARAAGTVTLTGRSMANIGNIFAAGEAVSIPLVFQNTDTSSYAFTVTYYVKDWQGLTSNSGTFTKTVAANGSATQTISPSVTLKGTYTLEVKAVSASPALTIQKSIPFSIVTPLSGSVGDGVFGINLHGDQPDKGDPQIQIPLAQKAGVQWVRDTVMWSNVEKSPGVYTFSAKLEQEVNLAKQAGMQVLLVLCYGNDLYQADGTATPHTAAQYTAFANYAAAVAQHYAGKVDHFEVWNEWNGGMGNPERYGASYYTALMKATYDAVKAANPNAILIGASTSTVDVPFISGILSNGGYDKMTSVSVHPYTDPSSAEVGNPGWYTIPSTVSSVSSAFSGYGTAKKIWMSEFGWSTATVDQNHQAAYTARAFATGISQTQTTGGVSKMFDYDFQDDGTNPADKESNWGLIYNWAANVEVPYAAKPSYVAYNEITSMLKGAAYAGTTDVDRVRMIKFTRASDNQDIVMMFNLDDVSVPVGIRGATASGMQAYDMFGNPIALPTSVSYAPVYLTGAQGSFNPEDISTSSSPILGDLKAESGSTTNDSAHLYAVKVTLNNDSILKSMSVNVKTAAGKMTMGVYTDNNGVPGALQAATPEFTPVAGWNTVSVTTPAVLPYGSYWLVFQPSSNSLATAFNASAGTVLVANRTYGALPASFPSSTPAAGTPSLYATFYTPHLIQNAVYTIEPLSSPGLLLNASGTADGSKTALTSQGAWWGSANTMKWKAVYAGQGYWKFYSQSSPSLLLNDKGGATSATQTQIGSDDGSDANLWKLSIKGDGIYQLSPKNAQSLALDVKGAGTSDGTPVQVYTINGTAAQQWKFNLYSASFDQPLSNDAIYTLEPLNAPGKNLTAEGSGNGSNVDIRSAQITSDMGSNQKWRAVDAGGGYWKFFPANAPSYDLDVNGGSGADGTNIQIWYDDAVDARLFMPASPVNGYYQIVPKVALSSRLDVAGMGTTDGTNVQIWSYNASSNQMWRFNLVSSYNLYN